MEKMIEQNDKPRAEIVVDVEILEVDETRVKNYGLNLRSMRLAASSRRKCHRTRARPPRRRRRPARRPRPRHDDGGGRSTPPDQVASPPVFNLNTITRGVATSDFYLAVPAAIVKFLETDTHTRLLAKPQLRGAEGSKLTLKLGTSFPVISTSYTPIATGGAGTNPLNSYSYKDLGINIDMTPRVTLEGDILLDVTIDDSAQGSDVPINGATYPSFTQRTITTKLRLRDGESNLLAGLLRQDESSTVNGFPGAVHLPLFAALLRQQRLERHHGHRDAADAASSDERITEADLRPLYIGSQGVAGSTLGVADRLR